MNSLVLKNSSKVVAWVMAIAMSFAFIAPASAFQNLGTFKYQWISQSGTLSADKTAHEVMADAGDTVPMSLTIRNRSTDPKALVMYGTSALQAEAGMAYAHAVGLGTSHPRDNVPAWIDASSFKVNGNRFAYYDGAAVNPGQDLTLSFNVKIDEDAADGVYDLYTEVVREWDGWAQQVTSSGAMVPSGDIFWRFKIGEGATSGDLEGGAGSVDSYALIAGLSNEEVGEDEEDVAVAGLEIEVDEGSDLEFTALKVVFDEGTAASDFEDYATEVSVWLGDEEVARVDADEFNDDNDWTSTISLDGAVAEAGDTVELTVAVSGIGNLDSADATDTWTVDMRQVRFVDADGATVSEDPGTAAVTFSFEVFATAANTEFKVSAGADEEEVNDGHSINIHATEETDDVEILSFNVEIEGTSDVHLDALPVNFDVTTQDNIDEMVSGMTLLMDGEEVGSVSMSTDGIEDADGAAVGADETYLFDDLDLTLEAGEDYEFLVLIDIYGITDTGDVAAGDTIAANFGETQMDLASFDAEDEAGEALSDADTTGTVTGSASEVRDIGINVELVSVDAELTAGEQAVNSDSGLFTITFDVTPFDGDVWIDLTAPDLTGGATESDLDQNAANGTLTGTIVGVSGFTTGTNGFRVLEGETGRFTITADVRDGATDLVDGFVDVRLGSILYALTDVDGDIVYNFDLVDFKTPQIFLDDRE